PRRGPGCHTHDETRARDVTDGAKNFGWNPAVRLSTKILRSLSRPALPERHGIEARHTWIVTDDRNRHFRRTF
ncbi:MAG: hypothetical protein KIT76_08845, partial [Pseudolabrys sp.]|nr:hypothetical protein [Pseudolabrys sp.]